MGKAVHRTAQEQAVWNLFTDDATGGYQAYGLCANPRCDDPSTSSLVCGRRPGARICVACFEYDFDCTHPTPARLAALRTVP